MQGKCFLNQSLGHCQRIIFNDKLTGAQIFSKKYLFQSLSFNLKSTKRSMNFLAKSHYKLSLVISNKNPQTCFFLSSKNSVVNINFE